MPGYRSSWARSITVAVLLVVLSGCAGQTRITDPEPPRATIQPTLLPTATNTIPVVPTAAVLDPTASPLPAPPVSGGAPVATPSAGPSDNDRTGPEPTPTIPGVLGPTFPADVNPLTGEQVAEASVLARRPVAVKISNYPPLVRPQSGLNSADLLFEHYAEGGVTRFTALFYAHDAEPVGSVRSGRLIDLEIPRMYDAAFAYSGSSGPVREMLRNSAFFSRIISPDFGHGGFYRVPAGNKPFEHTLFTSTTVLRAILEQRGLNQAPSLPVNMLFSATPINAGTPARTVEIQFRAVNAFWQYNEGSRRYFRWTDGAPHLDASSGQQVNFRNIVVLGAHHQDTTILEDFVNGGSYSIEIQVWGEGPVSIFRDGARLEGRWVRQDPSHMLTFYDLAGQPLPLAPGNTFFELVPLGFTGLRVGP